MRGRVAVRVCTTEARRCSNLHAPVGLKGRTRAEDRDRSMSGAKDDPPRCREAVWTWFKRAGRADYREAGASCSSDCTWAAASSRSLKTAMLVFISKREWKHAMALAA